MKKLKKSFIVDNGKEFSRRKELAQKIGMDMFFCDQYLPWQRGTDDNTNGLIRQFFQKGTNFDDITQEQLDLVVALINNRPRKRLDYRTPAERLEKFFH